MGIRYPDLAGKEEWSKRFLTKAAEWMMRKHVGVNLLVFRWLNPPNPLAQTVSGTPNFEEAYRETYGVSSGLGQEFDAVNNPISSQPDYVHFQVEALAPPRSFVPFSDQYHSQTDSTFVYSLDDRVKVGDFLTLEHVISMNTARSKRVWKVDHVESVGMTTRMYFQIIVTPFPNLPAHMLDVIEEIRGNV